MNLPTDRIDLRDVVVLNYLSQVLAVNDDVSLNLANHFFIKGATKLRIFIIDLRC
jgi:hypothetical protein